MSFACVLRMMGAALVLTCAAATAKADDAQTKAQVTIDNFAFSPQTVTVKAGTTVTWSNHDDTPHTVVSPQKFKSKALDSDDSFSFTFTTPGTYQYFCSLHPHMTGTIVVEAASSAK
jgi:plastocyanin